MKKSLYIPVCHTSNIQKVNFFCVFTVAVWDRIKNEITGKFFRFVTFSKFLKHSIRKYNYLPSAPYTLDDSQYHITKNRLSSHSSLSTSWNAMAWVDGRSSVAQRTWPVYAAEEVHESMLEWGGLTLAHLHIESILFKCKSTFILRTFYGLFFSKNMFGTLSSL